MPKEKVVVPPQLKYITGGRLNMVVLRANKEVSRIDTSSNLFLGDRSIVKHDTMDRVSFLPCAVFKVTLDFKKEQLCLLETSNRETTDWVLMSCMGNNAFYDKTTQRLLLQQCAVCLQTNVPDLIMPVGLVLRFDDDEWIVEQVCR
eukprot:GILI01007536.1.p1 GENE.GILI01007536.1~~GILI01007536.1.p1  ORF type:complete len:158 (-),score=13.84 GILI01007536.1:54-491(-)